MMDPDRTVWCGNISDKVTEDLLFELFLQAAPLERVKIPTDKDGRKSNFGFVTFKHNESVDYAVQLLNGISLFDKRLNVRPKNSNQPPQQRNMEAQVKTNQNPMAMMNTYNDLLRLGEMMHLGYNQGNNQGNTNFENHHGSRGHREREDRRKDDYKPYRHHDNRGSRFGNSSYQSPNSRASHNYTEQRNRRHRY